MQGGRGEGFTGSGGLLCEVGEHGGEVPDGDVGETESAEVRDEVLLDVLGIDPQQDLKITPRLVIGHLHAEQVEPSPPGCAGIGSVSWRTS